MEKNKGFLKGLVYKSTGSWYEVQSESGQHFKCRLRGKHKLDEKKVTNPIAVGDWVAFREEEGIAEQAVILDILDRKNYIIRKSTRKTAHGHIIAANLDQAIVMATLILPRTSSGFIDRFLVAAESFRIPAMILLNKCDLLGAKEKELHQQIIGIYEALGYSCLEISVKTGQGLDALQEQLKGKTSLIAGHSGVGKSSLLNRLHPKAMQKTDEVSSYALKGKHTTTFAQMFEIAPGTRIIDTPGIKEFGLMDIEGEELAHYFPELRDLIGQCKYYNCTHTHEPGCAIEEAFQEGSIAPSRYKNYLSMLENEDTHR